MLPWQGTPLSYHLFILTGEKRTLLCFKIFAFVIYNQLAASFCFIEFILFDLLAFHFTLQLKLSESNEHIHCINLLNSNI